MPGRPSWAAGGDRRHRSARRLRVAAGGGRPGPRIPLRPHERRRHITCATLRLAPSSGGLRVHMFASVDIAGTWWQYVGLFVAVAASWAGVPFIGATASARPAWPPVRGSWTWRSSWGCPHSPARSAGSSATPSATAGGANSWSARQTSGRPTEDGRARRTRLRPMGAPRGLLHTGHRLGHRQDATRAVRSLEPCRRHSDSRCRSQPARTGSGGSSLVTTRLTTSPPCSWASSSESW